MRFQKITKILCASKEKLNTAKKQPTEWEKNFANHVSDNELTFRIYKKSLKLNTKYQTTQFEN